MCSYKNSDSTLCHCRWDGSARSLQFKRKHFVYSSWNKSIHFSAEMKNIIKKLQCIVFTVWLRIPDETFWFLSAEIEAKPDDKRGGILIVSHCGPRLGNYSFPSLKLLCKIWKCYIAIIIPQNVSPILSLHLLRTLAHCMHASHIRFISYKIDTDEHPPTGLMYLWSSLDWGRYLLGKVLLGFSDVGCRRNTSPLNQNPQSCQILAFPKRTEIVTNKHRLKTPARRFDRSTYSAWRERRKKRYFPQ